MFCKPQLSHDFTGFQVAAEALVPGRTKPAAHGAARLRRNTQGATVLFGDKHRLHRIARAHIKQPFDRAIGRNVLRNYDRRRNMSVYFEFLAQRFCEVTHGIKTGRAFLMNPAEQLDCAITFFTQPFTKSGQALEVEIEQIGRHEISAAPGRPKRATVPSGGSAMQWSVGAMSYREYRFIPGKKKLISTAAVSTASEPCTALASMLSAKSARMLPAAAFLGSVAPIRSRFLKMALSPSST